MARVLIVFAHPALEKSRVHRRLVSRVDGVEGVTFHDLYEEYPTFAIDIEREKELLSSHDVIVLQHPFYWYSAPPLMKQWLDLVLEHGWAYGSEGDALVGKVVLQAITAGGQASAYCDEGYNRYTVRQYLRPFEGTTRLCGMRYLPPWVVFGTHRLSEGDIDAHADAFAETLRWLVAEGYEEIEDDTEALLVEVEQSCAPWIGSPREGRPGPDPDRPGSGGGR